MTFQITSELLSSILHDELNHVMDDESIDNLTYNIIIRLSETKKKSKKPKAITDDLVIYTDGACSGNGKKAVPTAGIGIYCNAWGISKSTDNDTFMYNGKKQTLSNPDTTVIYKNSNIRAEGYAILYSLWIIKFTYIDNKKINDANLKVLHDLKFLYPSDSIKVGDIIDGIEVINTNNKMATIVTDSLFWIKMIEDYIPNWVRQESVTTKKNIDLTIYIYYIYKLLEKNNVNIVLRHVHSHPNKKSDLSQDEIGNDHADKLAVSAKAYDHSNFILQFN